MKRTITTLTIFLALTLGLTAMAHAGMFSPGPAFEKNVNKALEREKRGNVEDAKDYWAKVAEYGEELLSDGTGMPGQYMGTARAYYALGDYAKAASLYEALFERGEEMGVPNLSSAYPWAYVYLGLSYAKLGEADKAIAAWQQVPMTVGSMYTTIQEQIAVLQGGE